MGVDVVTAMVVYTAATVAFYVLGSRHSQGYGDCPGRLSNGAIAGQRLHRDSG